MEKKESKEKQIRDAVYGILMQSSNDTLLTSAVPCPEGINLEFDGDLDLQDIKAIGEVFATEDITVCAGDEDCIILLVNTKK